MTEDAAEIPEQNASHGLCQSDVATAVGQVSGIKGLMTWSINWEGSQSFTFASNAKAVLGL